MEYEVNQSPVLQSYKPSWCTYSLSVLYRVMVILIEIGALRQKRIDVCTIRPQGSREGAERLVNIGQVLSLTNSIFNDTCIPTTNPLQGSNRDSQMKLKFMQS